ncbi:MAG TPA: DUF2071 domain-containing protein [Gemmatimonadaceae bacterium]|jgi:hypothetical protein|nr:DUF2071 domain-containing protein [Gemmatimonadaceae bacterium]
MSETASRVFLRADWRRLALLNYRVDPALLRPHVPRGTELDEWAGGVYVSVVGFLFQRTRVLGIPVPFHGEFTEVNLRFYVRRTVGTEIRRGVTFIRELVSSPLIVTAASALYNEPYLRADVTNELRTDGATYGWRVGGRAGALKVRPKTTAQVVADSEEEFMTMRHWGYTRQRDGSTLEYGVEHPRWMVQRCDGILTGDRATAFGNDFANVLLDHPHTAMVADGSAVTLSFPRRVG